MPPNKFLNSSVWLRIQEMMSVQSEGCCAHDTDVVHICLSSFLGYRDGTIIAILTLHVVPMPPINFQLNSTYSLGDVVSRISRWPPWLPYWISKRSDFRKSEAPCRRLRKRKHLEKKKKKNNNKKKKKTKKQKKKKKNKQKTINSIFSQFSNSESPCSPNASHQLSAFQLNTT